MDTDILDTNDSQWPHLLSEVPHDFYHLPGYVTVSAQHDGGTGYLFVALEGTNMLLLPLILRPIQILGEPAGMWDAVSPYGYPGPLLKTDASPEAETFVERAVQALVERLINSKVVSMFMRFHPLFNVPLEPFARHGSLIDHGDTVLVDLTVTEEEMWRKTRPNHRRDINRALREGFQVYMDEGWNYLEPFMDLYTETMKRLSADPYYFFPPQYFSNLRLRLPNHLHLCVVTIDGQVASAGLFSEACGIVEYLFSGTKQDFLGAHPLKIMLNFARSWAKRRGNRIFQLGGGVGGKRDSLYHFKAGFSELTRPFRTWRLVVDPDSYSRLVKRWEYLSGVKANGVDGFFPAYRKSIRLI